MGFQVPYKSSISEKRPRVPAWHPSDSDSTWSHDIKSIKTHCGTFTARLDKKSCFGCRTNIPDALLFRVSDTPSLRRFPIHSDLVGWLPLSFRV